MTEDPHDNDYLELFKPKTDSPQAPASDHDDSGQTGAPDHPSPAVDESSLSGEGSLDSPEVYTDPSRSPQPSTQGPAQAAEGHSGGGNDVLEGFARSASVEPEFEALAADSSEAGQRLRTVGMAAGGGCLLLMLLAVVVFAFLQVFGRRGEDEKPQDTPAPTEFVTVPPVPTAAAAESPLFVPLVNSGDVRVPLALPERLAIGESIYQVQAVEAPSGAWPAVPTAGGAATWVNGTVVNYILGLAPTPENTSLIASLQAGDSLRLHMSTGLILSFNVSQIATGRPDEAALFDQISPRLTLALLTNDPAQRTVLSAVFFSDEADDTEVFAEAAIGLIGTPVNQGPVRVTVVEVYQVAGAEAGLPHGTGYLLMDLRVENVGTTVLNPAIFQTFVADAMGERYPLTMLAEQFAHHGIPTQPLAPGETVIGSLGFLMPGGHEGQVRWVFNPVPGSSSWVVVPLSYEFPPPPPTSEPSQPVGFASVTVNTDDVFIDTVDGLLDIGLGIENISAGVVQVTEDDIGLSSWTDGPLTLVAPAPQFPWVLEPGRSGLFQLQFQLPTADTALLEVLGYTFSIENLGGE